MDKDAESGESKENRSTSVVWGEVPDQRIVRTDWTSLNGSSLTFKSRKIFEFE